MTVQDQAQFLRKATLLVVRAERGRNSSFVPASTIDLSEMHFTFKTAQQDVESPNNCVVRVYNLAPATVEAITKFEYTRVIVQGGYEGVGVGAVFDGTIKQFRIGKLNATDTFLEILAADGDQAYNFATVNTTLAAGSTAKQRVDAAISAMKPHGVDPGDVATFNGGTLPRGKVLFGTARALLRHETQTNGATWSVDNGRVNVIPLTGYRPGEAVVLSAMTGLLGVPEQTNEGVVVRCLLNPRLVIGGLFKVDNRSVNKLIQQDPNAAPVAFNQYTGIQNLATVAADGLYRAFVVEHEGDTRGALWSTRVIGLAVNPAEKKVKAYG